MKSDYQRPGSGPYDQEWATLSARHRRYHPVCEVVGCGHKAEHVDHIITIAARPDLRLDPTNLQSLCQHHHSALTMAYDSGRLDGACDPDGMPLDPSHPWNSGSSAEAIRNTNNRPKADPIIAARLKRRFVNGFGRQ